MHEALNILYRFCLRKNYNVEFKPDPEGVEINITDDSDPTKSCLHLYITENTTNPAELILKAINVLD